MRVNYHGGDSRLCVLVPRRINPYWTKQMLRAIAARHGYTKYGYWVQF